MNTDKIVKVIAQFVVAILLAAFGYRGFIILLDGNHIFWAAAEGFATIALVMTQATWIRDTIEAEEQTEETDI